VATTKEAARLACHFKNDFILGAMPVKTAKYLVVAGVASLLSVAQVCRMIFQKQEQRMVSNTPQDRRWVLDFWQWCALQKEDDLGELLDDIAVLPVAKKPKPQRTAVFSENSSFGWGDLVEKLERFRERHRCVLLPEDFDSDMDTTLRRCGELPMLSAPGLEKFVHSGSTDGIILALSAALASGQSQMEKVLPQQLRSLLGLLASETAVLTNSSSKSLQDVCLQLPFFIFCKEQECQNALWAEEKDQVGFAHLQIVPHDISEGLINALRKANMQDGEGKFLVLHETHNVARLLKSKLGVRQVDIETFLKETVCSRLSSYPSAVRDEIMEEILKDERLVPDPAEALLKPDSLFAMLRDFKFIESRGEGLLAPKDVLSPEVITLFPLVQFPKLPMCNMFRKKSNQRVLSQLSRLGLRSVLNADEIILVAEYIAEKKDAMLARILLPYLAKHHFVPQPSNMRSLFENLRGIRWLPALERPADWFGKWRSDELGGLLLADSDEVWQQSHSHIVGFVRPIFDQTSLFAHPDFPSLQSTPSELKIDEFCKVLGVQSVTDLQDEVLVENFQAMTDCWQKHACVVDSKESLFIVGSRCMDSKGVHATVTTCDSGRGTLKGASAINFYTITYDNGTVDKAMPRNSMAHVCEICESVERFVPPMYELMSEKACALFKGPWIWASRDFVSPQCVVKDSRAKKLTPYLYELEESWKRFSVFSNIPTTVSSEALLVVLSEAQKQQEHDQEGCSQDYADIAINALLLLDRVATDAILQDVKDLIIPTSENILVSVWKVYFTDMDWHPPTDHIPNDLQSVSERVPGRLLQNFQVPFLSDLLLEHFNAQDAVTFDEDAAASNLKQLSRCEWSFSLGVVGITNLVKQWLQVGAELGAKEFEIVADLRDYFGQKSLMTPDLAALQNSGSLWLWCDVEIGASKWSQILECDPCFKWLFEVTKQPVIISGGLVAFFNLDEQPTFRRASKEGQIHSHFKLLQYHTDLQRVWPDQFRPYLHFLEPHPAKFPGTLIRLPFHNVKDSRLAGLFSGMVGCQRSETKSVELFEGRFKAMLQKLTQVDDISPTSPSTAFQKDAIFQGYDVLKFSELRGSDKTLNFKLECTRTPLPNDIADVVVNVLKGSACLSESWIVAKFKSQDEAVGIACAKDIQIARKYFGKELKIGLLYTESGELVNQKALAGCLIQAGSRSDTAKSIGETFGRLFRYQIEARSNSMTSSVLLEPNISCHWDANESLFDMDSAVQAILTLSLNGVALAEYHDLPTPNRELSKEAQEWIFRNLRTLTCPQWLTQLLLPTSNTINPVSWSRVKDSYSALCQIECPGLLENLLFWAMDLFPDKSFATAPIVVEDGTLVRTRAVGDVFWFVGPLVMIRGLLKYPQGSKKVVISEKYLGKLNQLGLLSPLRYEHVAQQVDNIDARKFWKLIQKKLDPAIVVAFRAMLSLRRDDTLFSRDFTCLEKKLDVRISLASGIAFVPFVEYCALAHIPYPSGVKDLLIKMGAGFADETIPSTGEKMKEEGQIQRQYYVGGSAGFVLRYLKKHKNQLKWEHANSAIAIEILLPFLSHRDPSATLFLFSGDYEKESECILFNELLLVCVNGKPAPLSQAVFLHQCSESSKLAKLFRPHMPIFSQDEAIFKSIRSFHTLAQNRKAPIQILQSCTLNPTLYGRISEANQMQILFLVSKEMTRSELEQLSTMQVILGGQRKCVADLWDPSDSLVRLKVSDSADPASESVCRDWVPTQLQEFMRNTRRFADLLVFFDGLQGTIPREKTNKYESEFWARLESLKLEEVAVFKKRHGSRAVVPIGLHLHAPAKVCQTYHLPLVGLTEAPLLQRDLRRSILEALFDGEPEVKFVVKQLMAVSQDIGEALTTPEKLRMLLPVYEFLAMKIQQGKPEDKTCIIALRDKKCVFGETGRIDFPYHVSAAQLVDKPPRYCIHSALRSQRLKDLWREIGVHQQDDLRDLPAPFHATGLATMLMDDHTERDLWLACCAEVDVKVHKLLWVFACPMSKALIRPRPDEHATYELKLPRDAKFEKEIVDIIVEYVYTGRVSDQNLTPTQAIRALELAEALNIEYVKEYLNQFLEGAPVNRVQDVTQASSVSVPIYWKNKVNFHRVGTNYMKHILQTFMASSVCCPIMRNVQVVSVERIENESLWQMYQAKKESLRKFLSAQGSSMRKLSGVTQWQPELTNAGMSPETNEFFLFHGTSLSQAEIISQQGFDARVASLTGLYGAGSYFAINACKSHQYSVSKKPAGSSDYIMLVCRVSMGMPYCTSEQHANARRPPDNPATLGRPFDSIFAEHGKGRRGDQQHHEYVVFDGYQAYPEFIVRYRV